MFERHELSGSLFVLRVLKHTLFNEVRNDRRVPFDFIPETINEGISNIACAGSLAVVDVKAGRLARVSERRVDQLVKAHHQLDLSLDRVLEIFDILGGRFISKGRTWSQDEHKVEPLLDLSELSTEYTAHVHDREDRTH